MTVYKPMTPKLRNQIDYAYRKQMQELDGCENTPWVFNPIYRRKEVKRNDS